MLEPILINYRGASAERGENEAPGFLPQAIMPGLQLWCCDLDDPQVLAHCDESFLATDEWQRAGRLRSEWQRQLFMRRRAMRRFLIGEFLGISPRLICFAENIFGKPKLAFPVSARFEFSTSHSENIFAMAIAPQTEIGVDVEVSRPDWNVKSIAGLYLNQQQIAQLEKFPCQEQQKQFLRFWSLLEAFAKASGKGVAQPSDGQISAENAWDLIFSTNATTPKCNWFQSWRRIGGHQAVISVASGPAKNMTPCFAGWFQGASPVSVWDAVASHQIPNQSLS